MLRALREVYSGAIIVQAKVGRFHVDLFLPEIGIIVEIDGPWHWTGEVSRRDLARDANLRCLGYCVVRIPCEQVRASPRPSDRRASCALSRAFDKVQLGGVVLFLGSSFLIFLIELQYCKKDQIAHSPTDQYEMSDQKCRSCMSESVGKAPPP